MLCKDQLSKMQLSPIINLLTPGEQGQAMAEGFPRWGHKQAEPLWLSLLCQPHRQVTGLHSTNNLSRRREIAKALCISIFLSFSLSVFLYYKVRTAVLA